MTKEAVRKYKREVVGAVEEQARGPLKTLRHQAMLTREEASKREAAERRAEERVAEAERRAQMAEERLREQVRVSGELSERLERLEHSHTTVRSELLKEREKRERFAMLAGRLKERLSDIPLPEVMARLGYRGERVGEAVVYRDAQRRVALSIRDGAVSDSEGSIVCRNSVDLVVHMRGHNEGIEGYDQTQALEWLRDQFGDHRAAGAAVAHREQYALEFFGRLREERERSLVLERGTDPWHGPQGRAEDHDRPRHDDRPDGRGGRRSSFGSR